MCRLGEAQIYPERRKQPQEVIVADLVAVAVFHPAGVRLGGRRHGVVGEHRVGNAPVLDHVTERQTEPVRRLRCIQTPRQDLVAGQVLEGQQEGAGDFAVGPLDEQIQLVAVVVDRLQRPQVRAVTALCRTDRVEVISAVAFQDHDLGVDLAVELALQRRRGRRKGPAMHRGGIFQPVPALRNARPALPQIVGQEDVPRLRTDVGGPALLAAVTRRQPGHPIVPLLAGHLPEPAPDRAGAHPALGRYDLHRRRAGCVAALHLQHRVQGQDAKLCALAALVVQCVEMRPRRGPVGRARLGGGLGRLFAHAARQQRRAGL